VPIEQLTYAQIAERLGITADAARAIVQRHRLPRARANDSNKVLVTIDLADIQHKPRIARSSPDQEPAADPIAPLMSRIAELEAEVEKRSVDHQAHIAALEAELEQCSRDHQARVAELESELAQAEQRSHDHRADYERERVRAACIEAELAQAEQRSHDHRADYERERVRADCMAVDQDRLIRQIEGLNSLELGTRALLQASQSEQVHDKLLAELEEVRERLRAAQSAPTSSNDRAIITRTRWPWRRAG
jgi:chromosome segregation ATPase